ncbi:ppx/GppA phosphatase family domain-containing protein [Ditylenchus destructor]|nr:ppx/GppA phosphatase family domain-containing protein [Ditylenchus destructor]
MLTEEAAQRGLECLKRFADRLADLPTRQVRAVATQTLREARNRNAFLARAQQVLGHPIEVISGREEARLIYAGVARMQTAEDPRLVIDIGGRSTEMILGRGPQPLRAESFQIGSVSLSMRYFPDGRFTSEAFREAQVAAGAELEEAMNQFAPGRAEGRPPGGRRRRAVHPVHAAHAFRHRPALSGQGRAASGRHLRSGRAAGSAAAGRGARHARAVGVGAATPLRGGPRSGKSVQQIAQRLHAQLSPKAEEEHRRELGWAAALHEIGMMVSHHDHHRHSAYLLSHVDAPGFSQNQLRRLGDLALGQRGGLRKLEEQLQDESVVWQLLSLRLAAIKCHARSAVDASAMKLHRDGDQVTIELRKGWADGHPRAHFLLKEELEAWSKLGRIQLALDD